MTALRTVIALVLALALSAPVLAADHEAGLCDLGRGGLETPLDKWILLDALGNANAQFCLGMLHEEGIGVAQDYAEALRLYRLSAERGNPAGQTALGNMYAEGRGVPQDYAEAVNWFRRGAEQGYTPAQCDLGSMYEEGRGVPQDYVQAHMWYNLAAARSTVPGNRDPAVRNRDNIEGKMTPDQVAEAQRLAREWKPK